MGPPWLLANCHKEEATVRILKKNMAREVKAAKLLGAEAKVTVKAEAALPVHGTPHFLIRPSQLPGTQRVWKLPKLQ